MEVRRREVGAAAIVLATSRRRPFVTMYTIAILNDRANSLKSLPFAGYRFFLNGHMALRFRHTVSASQSIPISLPRNQLGMKTCRYPDFLRVAAKQWCNERALDVQLGKAPRGKLIVTYPRF